MDIKASLGKSLLSCGTYEEAIACVDIVLKKVSECPLLIQTNEILLRTQKILQPWLPRQNAFTTSVSLSMPWYFTQGHSIFHRNAKSWQKRKKSVRKQF